MSADRRPGRRRPIAVVGALAACALVAVAVLGSVLALTGVGLDCTASAGTGRDGPAASQVARDEIPGQRLRLYQAAAQRFDIDWAFLAAIAAQECDHGSCRGDNGYGCAGPMQIAVRRDSPCSPGRGPTLWERFRADGDRDGHTDVDDPADAIFTAARILRFAKGAPASGGSYAEYRQAACNYYGACADSSATYADEVMARAVRYGFNADAQNVEPADADAFAEAPAGCTAAPAGAPAGGGGFGAVIRARGPRQLARLPASVTAGRPIGCDARIVDDVVWLARRYRVQVTACFAIHAHGGEHPLGAATDLVPQPGSSWPDTTEALARAAGWQPTCSQGGTAPVCAKPPFRFIAYNGYPGHGDPAHCQPPSCAAHLHLSWLTSASPAQQENELRATHYAPAWIDVFQPTGDDPDA